MYWSAESVDTETTKIRDRRRIRSRVLVNLLISEIQVRQRSGKATGVFASDPHERHSDRAPAKVTDVSNCCKSVENQRSVSKCGGCREKLPLTLSFVAAAFRTLLCEYSLEFCRHSLTELPMSEVRCRTSRVLVRKRLGKTLCFTRVYQTTKH